MIVSIASGKGGTGKTLVATSLALSLKSSEKVQLLDCDVEEPNDHVFLKPEIINSEAVSVMVPAVDEVKCSYCGKCAQVCAYNAIAVLGNHVLTFLQLCHGCGACSYLCPEKAISEKTKLIMLAHTLGKPFNLDLIAKLAKKYNLFLIEDCCDALGSTYRNKPVGTFGNLATYSFYPAHQITLSY